MLCFPFCFYGCFSSRLLSFCFASAAAVCDDDAALAAAAAYDGKGTDGYTGDKREAG